MDSGNLGLLFELLNTTELKCNVLYTLRLRSEQLIVLWASAARPQPR